MFMNNTGGLSPSFFLLPLVAVLLVTASGVLGSSPTSVPPETCSEAIALRRFPVYGTPEFDHQCPWTAQTKNGNGYEEGKCTILVRPGESSNEGLAEFLSDVAGGAVHAAQLSCHLVLDYGPGVDIQKVLKPVDGTPAKNWTVPSPFKNSKDCSGRKHNCHRMTNTMGEKRLKLVAGSAASSSGSGLPPVTPVTIPSFRFAYTHYDNQGEKHDLIPYAKAESSPDTLPDFRFETGMACALGSTFKFSVEGASEFVPHIAETFQTVQDEHTLVVAVYLRTGQTDKMAQHERKQREGKDAGTAPVDAVGIRGLNLKALRCAERIEEDWLSRPAHRNTTKRTVWMVTSDSPHLVGKVVEQYSGRTVASAMNSNSTNSSPNTVKRTVLTTGARGIQTRTARSPATDEFVEALADWWLLGESDVIVSHSLYSFAHTAGMRTARPIYRATGGGDCYRLPLPTIEKTTEVFPRYKVE
mmetsp:Transcript_29671/g.65738  ORF Transcript_29671/g.65738 Transcript_29671/m.65738 type:complete len:470 (-) Transcript_29671:1147-2556(-)